MDSSRNLAHFGQRADLLPAPTILLQISFVGQWYSHARNRGGGSLHDEIVQILRVRSDSSCSDLYVTFLWPGWRSLRKGVWFIGMTQFNSRGVSIFTRHFVKDFTTLGLQMCLEMTNLQKCVWNVRKRHTWDTNTISKCNRSIPWGCIEIPKRSRNVTDVPLWWFGVFGHLEYLKAAKISMWYIEFPQRYTNITDRSLWPFGVFVHFKSFQASSCCVLQVWV